MNITIDDRWNNLFLNSELLEINKEFLNNRVATALSLNKLFEKLNKSRIKSILNLTKHIAM